MNVLDTEETGNAYTRTALIMGEDLKENHLKINVKFYDDTPLLNGKIYN